MRAYSREPYAARSNDGPERTYRVGESWAEQPGDHHQKVSQNASATEPAKLLAVFVMDTKDRQIVSPGQVVPAGGVLAAAPI